MYLIITASPNTDGLTDACAKAMSDGVASAGGETEIIDISAAKLEPCRICGNGWGTCRKTTQCVIDDILGELQTKIRASEALILVTPVYFGQPSERMKFFLDRFRRCEAFSPTSSAAFGKEVDLIAAAGGSGNGTATCLAEMEIWCRHVGATPQERIGITNYTREFSLEVIRNAGTRLVKGEYFKRKRPWHGDWFR